MFEQRVAELASLSEPAGAFSSSVSEMDCDVLLVDPFARRSLSHSLSLSLFLVFRVRKFSAKTGENREWMSWAKANNSDLCTRRRGPAHKTASQPVSKRAEGQISPARV